LPTRFPVKALYASPYLLAVLHASPISLTITSALTMTA
jgi:hypothetical protein